MYNLPHHKARSKEEVFAFIQAHPFATVIGCNAAGEPVATQLPLLIEESGEQLKLIGHLMRNTDHHKTFLQNPHVLCLFTGADAYVSATWYKNPNKGSTWNYMTVHAKGTIQFVEGEDLHRIMQTTTLHFEGGNTESPTVYNNLTQEYRDRLGKAIAGFTINITALDTVFKLSQDEPVETYDNVIQKLSAGDNGAKMIAEEMQHRRASIFGAE